MIYHTSASSMQEDTAPLETLQAMRRQEKSYTKRDFFLQAETGNADAATTCPQHHNIYPLHIDVDVDCRDKMCAWSHQIVDFCKFRRESVEIAMSYLDRFLLTPAGAAVLQDRNLYQLTAMTSLYTTIKIHEHQALNPQVVSQLSRGAYTVDQIEEMEEKILAALDWRVNPPTALSFVREFLTILPVVISEQAQETILKLAAVQTELAVSNYALIATPASTIAYCAFMNALESTTGAVRNNDAGRYIGMVLAHAIGLDAIDDCDAAAVVLETQRCLYPACLAAAQQEQSETTTTHQKTVPSNEKRDVHRRASFEESPRSVSNSSLV